MTWLSAGPLGGSAPPRFERKTTGHTRSGMRTQGQERTSNSRAVQLFIRTVRRPYGQGGRGAVAARRGSRQGGRAGPGDGLTVRALAARPAPVEGVPIES